MMDINTLYETPPWDWPDGVATLLLELLESEEAGDKDRLKAAELAGDFVVVNDDLAVALLAVARDGAEPGALRVEAAFSLGSFLEAADTLLECFPGEEAFSTDAVEEVSEGLRGLYEDPDAPDELRRAALESSARSPREWHAGAVKNAYSGEDEGWRLSAVFCMQYVDGFRDAVLAELENENPEFRYNAVQAAGTLEIADAWPRLVSMLTGAEPDRDVLIAAIEAAVDIDLEEARKVLADLMDTADEEIADAAMEAIMLAEEMFCDEFDDESGVELDDGFDPV